MEGTGMVKGLLVTVIAVIAGLYVSKKLGIL